ncbi:hypothetical protein BJV82DRAFT_615929 [Fennellomyces sp. T-0311]|nr:hypothetical protein BJV82DRAFT_615929 [Fennellomyces sp. T-0311]
MATTIFGESTPVNDQLNDLFKNSAGPSAVANAPVPTAAMSKRKQKKLLAQKAEAAVDKARLLSSLPELRKRKAEVLENDAQDTEAKAEEKAPAVAKKKQKSVIKAEQREKDERSIFVGNVPVSCTEKPDSKEFKRKFAEYGAIESIRFRSVAFSEQTSRKAAFIKKKLHSNRSVANAYIVYKEKASAEKALAMNGQLFMEKHLRVDSVTDPKPHDRKRSVFIGSLPHDTEEEELWTFFKDCGEIESVRIVRDKATNIGKGIGYVQFKRRNTVDMALALDDKKFREKNTLRVQRCKAEKDQAAVVPGFKGAKGAKKGGKKDVTVTKPPRFVTKKSFKKALPLTAKFEGARSSKASGNTFKTGKTTKSPKHKLTKRKQKK